MLFLNNLIFEVYLVLVIVKIDIKIEILVWDRFNVYVFEFINLIFVIYICIFKCFVNS